MTVNVPDTRRLAPEADPSMAAEVHAAEATRLFTVEGVGPRGASVTG